MKLKLNCCDGMYNSYDVHFTSICDNSCGHCIDHCYQGINQSKPNVTAIVNTILEKKDKIDDVLFLGGEPCLFLEELVDCVKQLKENTKLKLYVTTAVPKVCSDKRDLFIELIELLDGINLSVQHYDESIADSIRQTKSQYNRQEFYNSLPHKDKIRINLNIVKPFLYTKEELVKCLNHYDKMGFNSIKLSEIQHGKEYFVSFEQLFNLRMNSPYSSGCQSYINTDKIIKGFKTPLLLKRSCFLCEETLKASIPDGIKLLTKFFYKPRNTYGVVYENGKLTKGWL
jgi:pyruvate-formate lyase-activating enzyme